MTTTEIENLIRQGLPTASVQVVDEVGDGNHFAAMVIDEAFLGKGTLERHRMVNATVHAAIADGRIHALSIKTSTPEERARTAAAK